MRALTGSPSSGEFEALLALRHAGGSRGLVTAAKIKRRFPKRVTVTQVRAILDGLSSTYVTADGNGSYRLTAAGALRARQNPPRRWIAVI